MKDCIVESFALNGTLDMNYRLEKDRWLAWNFSIDGSNIQGYRDH